MDESWTRRLSDYLDDELNPAQREEVESALARSPELRVVLEELKRVVGRAGSLEERPPTRDLWPGIARGIGIAERERSPETGSRPAVRKRLAFSLPQLAAAAVVVMLVSGAGAWILKPAAGDDGAGHIQSLNPVARTVSAGGGNVSAEYQQAIHDMLQVLEEGRDVLDSATIKTIEESLITIDRAIEDAARALAEDSTSAYLNSHLSRALRQKFDLLRSVNEMVGAARS